MLASGMHSKNTPTPVLVNNCVNELHFMLKVVWSTPEHVSQQEKILIAAVCVSYVVSQDALFIESHTLFDLDLIADHRLTDHHITRNVDVVPDVRVV